LPTTQSFSLISSNPSHTAIAATATATHLIRLACSFGYLPPSKAAAKRSVFHGNLNIDTREVYQVGIGESSGGIDRRWIEVIEEILQKVPSVGRKAKVSIKYCYNV